MPSSVPASIKPSVSIDEVDRIDVRVGTIEALTEVSGSEKLVELRVSFGDHTRQVLVGMKHERADPAEVVGRQALFVVNLPPRRMAGRTSEAMLFDIGHADGLVPVLAVPEREVPAGTRAG
jgi:tRNA-binding protein